MHEVRFGPWKHSRHTFFELEKLEKVLDKMLIIKYSVLSEPSTPFFEGPREEGNWRFLGIPKNLLFRPNA